MAARHPSPRKSEAKLSVAPHPVPKGMEGRPCPVSGFSSEALRKLQEDPDVASESLALSMPQSARSQKERNVVAFVKLNVFNSSHHVSADTRALVKSIGGLPKLRSFTNTFYKLCFADPHIDKFIASHADPHGERFATWIAEKMGDGTPWTDERRTREVRTMKFDDGVVRVAHDRSSAHYAAWHSPKREAEKWGQHFQVDDARIWMRLHFWAARLNGLFEPEHAAFMDYYTRFIGHFVSVYSSKSPPFTRESARWSADPANIEKYVVSGNMMTDVLSQSLEQAVMTLPSDERLYTGSKHPSPSWPYDVPVQR